MERDAFKASPSESQALRKLGHRSPIERSAIDAVTRAQRLLGSDPAGQVERLLASDPARQFERQVREFERTQETLVPKFAVDAISRAEGILGSPGVREIERLRELERLHQSVEMARPEPTWDLTPSRDFHLEALADIQHSIRFTAQQQAEKVQAAIVDHIRQRQEGLEDDQQLLVYCETEHERIRVLEIVVPNHHAVIFNGVDDDGNSASLIVTVNNVKITSKVVRVPPPDKPSRIGFPTE
jgi:hypothetical protein